MTSTITSSCTVLSKWRVCWCSVRGDNHTVYPPP